MKELVEEIAKALVDKPDAVSASEAPGPEGTTIKLTVDPSDVGKVIGKQGRTARSMRTVVNAAASKLDKRYQLEIAE
ncbi:MAG: KH domain-containing protein [Bryobacteraceae bacterium]|nr:KH domain-containing protein [Bryobacteraceae bacterium]